MKFSGSRVCFIGAHPDDIELGCGGLIAEINQKTEVFCFTLSDNQKNPDLKNLVNEHYQSMQVLGVDRAHATLGSFETRRFPDCRQEILEYFIKIKKTVQPEIVFVHTTQDIHQDHATITQEALRAFRGITVLGYDVLRSSYGFFPHFLVEISENSVNKKLEALAQYHTYKDRYYFDADILKATAIRHGALAEKKFAEGFDILRIVGQFN